MKLTAIGRNRWTVARSTGKTIAEISLSKGEYVVKPLKKLTKVESDMVAAFVVGMRLEAAGEPGKGTDEAFLGRIEEALDRYIGRFEDRELFPELVAALDAASDKAQDIRHAMRLLRAA